MSNAPYNETNQAASKEVAELFKLMLDNMPNSSVMMFDLDMRYTLAGGPFLWRFNMTPEQIVGKQPQDIYSPEVCDFIIPIYRRALNGESFNYDRSTPDYTYQAYVTPVRDAAGYIIGGMNLSHDTTQIRRSANALQESEKRYQSVVTTMSEGVVVTDENGAIQSCNPAAERILGLTADQMTGRTSFDPRWRAIHEDGSPFPGETHPSLITLKTGQPFSDVIMGVHKPDDSLVWISTNSQPLTHPDETHPYAVVTTLIDITARKQNADALQRSEEQFRATFDYAAIGIALVGLDGRWLQVNRAVCEIVGYSEAELLAKTFIDITHPDDLDIDLKYVRQLLAGEIASYQMEKRYFHKLGYEVWVLLSVSLVQNSEGQPVHFVSQIQNINERKLAERALTIQIEQEHEFQTYLKALHEITIELTTIDDLDKFYKQAVEFGLQRLGFDRFGLLLYDPKLSLVKGTYGTDAHGKLVDEHHIRLDPSRLTGILARAYQNEDRFVVDEDTQLFSDFQSIGTGWNAAAVLWNGVEKLGWLAIDNGTKHLPMTKPVLDILGLYAMTLGSLLAQKHTRTALIEQRNLLRMLIDNIPDYIFLKDAQGHFILTNTSHAQASGNIEPKDLIGKTAFDVFPPELAHQFHTDDQALIQSGQSLINAERETVDAQGNHKLVLTSKIPWRDSNNQILGLVGISRDITDRKRLEALQIEQEKLQTAFNKERELSQLKTRMMERITHEFRTPLTVIQSSTETLTSYLDRLTPEQKTARFNAIQQTNRHLTAMLDEIGMVVSGNLSPDNLVIVPLNLGQIIRAVALELEAHMNLPGKFVLNIPDTIILSANREHLKLALFHTMRNAARFSPPQSPVTITASLTENRVELSITDTGIGILPDEQPRIFEPFFRGSNINEIGGLGLGLSIAQGAIQAHNGTITVESHPGQGTTVSITLPA